MNSSLYQRSRASAGLPRLIQAAKSAVDAATDIVYRSQDLVLAARAGCHASRPHLRYASLDGEVGGIPVRAVVRTDGTATIDKHLAERAEMLIALGETLSSRNLQASLNAGPLAATLTLIRACDRLHALEMPLRSFDGAGTRLNLTSSSTNAAKGRRGCDVRT